MSRARGAALVSAEDIMEFDLESNPVDQRGRRMFLERFIHGSAYRERPDVNAVVHSHSPTMIPFSVTGEPLRGISHIASFLAEEVPVWRCPSNARSSSSLPTRPKRLDDAWKLWKSEVTTEL
jgi:HCOMODA/2-hydroxy-3-carboxy-muconic semialdehyde decarboxylase